MIKFSGFKFIHVIFFLIATNIVSIILFNSFGRELKFLIKYTMTQVQIWRASTFDDYLTTVTKGQYKILEDAGSNSFFELSQAVLETSVLPLNIVTLDIQKAVPFANGGGALSVANGKLLLIDRLGVIYFFEKNKFTKILAPKLPNNISLFIKNSGNLNASTMRVHSIAYDEERSNIYVSYTKYIDEKSNRFCIAKLNLLADGFVANGDWSQIYESQNVYSSQVSMSGGGKLLISNNKLYFAVGYADSIGLENEWEDDNWLKKGSSSSNTQDNNSSFGKIFEFDLITNNLLLFSKGHRNVQGLASTEKNRIYSVEHGPQGGDEINLVVEKGNYGWPLKTDGTRYGTYDFNGEDSKKFNSNFKEPFFEFVPSVGISSIVSASKFHKRWKDDLLVGSLKAQSIYRIHLNNDKSAVIYSEPIWIGHRIRDTVIFNKAIWILSDDAKLVQLFVNQNLLMLNNKADGLVEAPLKPCTLCHSFEPSTPSNLAPSLMRVLGKKKGADTFPHYSKSFKEAKDSWNESNLTNFLLNPQSEMPGTTMPATGLSKQEVNQIVKALSKH